MVARGPGAVGCAHCTKLGAESACAVCKHLVCATCAADWATCDRPSGRVFRLGMTARLVDVDPGGRVGLVTRWRGKLKLVDLRGLAWIDEPDLPHPGTKELRPRVTSDGRLYSPEVMSGFTANEMPLFLGLRITTLGTRETVVLKQVPALSRCTGTTALDDQFYYVTETELVAILDGAEGARVFEPLPKKVLQAVDVDTSRGVIASATWGEIAVHRIVDDRLVLAGHVKTSADARWVQLGGSYLAALLRGGPQRGLTVWRLYDDLSIASVAVRIEADIETAALSRDGRYVAIGFADGVLEVRGLTDGYSEQFGEHTDTISYLRFVGDEHLLVSADDDNRVVIRPRGDAGYARTVLSVELAS